MANIVVTFNSACLFFIDFTTSFRFVFRLPTKLKSLCFSKAGVGSPENPDQLMIALEPEAAAIFCQEKNLSDFQAEVGSRPVDGILSQINTHYVVVDIGGM